MTIKNSDLPAIPQPMINHDGDIYTTFDNYGGKQSGLTKCEKFCLEMGAPNTGDPLLDEIIIKGNRNKAAMMAMQGLLASASDSDGQWTNAGTDNVAFEAVCLADALLKELEK